MSSSVPVKDQVCWKKNCVHSGVCAPRFVQQKQRSTPRVLLFDVPNIYFTPMGWIQRSGTRDAHVPIYSDTWYGHPHSLTHIRRNLRGFVAFRNIWKHIVSWQPSLGFDYRAVSFYSRHFIDPSWGGAYSDGPKFHHRLSWDLKIRLRLPLTVLRAAHKSANGPTSLLLSKVSSGAATLRNLHLW